MLYFHYYYYFVACKKNKKIATQGQCYHVKEKATHGKNYSESVDRVLRTALPLTCR